MLETLTHHKRFSLIYFLILSIAVLLSTIYIWHVRYWNDEWRSLADIMVYGVNVISYRGATMPFAWYQIGNLLLRGRLLGELFFNRLQYASQYAPYSIISLMIAGHVVNSFLLFTIVKRETKNISIAIIASFFFAVSSIHTGNFLWLGAGFYDVLSLTPALLCVMLLQHASLKRKYFFGFLAFLTAFIAFEMKENCAFLFLFIPAYFIAVKNKIPRSIMTVLVSMIVVLTLVLGAISYWHEGQIIHLQNQYLTLAKICFNFVYYPIANFAQFIIPYDGILLIRTWLSAVPANILAPITSPVGISSNLFLFDCLSILFTLGVSALLYKIYKKYPRLRTSILIGICWYVISMAPLAVRLPSRFNGYISYAYLYHPLVGVCILFSCILLYLIDLLGKKTKLPVIHILLVFYFLLNFYAAYLDSEFTVEYSRMADIFISLFQPYVHSLPNKPIFYIINTTQFANRTTETRLPFMLGSGFIVSILSYQSGVIPRELLAAHYLESFDSQGYKEVGTKGYGYYWNYGDLKKELQNNPNISVNQVVVLEFSANERRLTDMSEDIRKGLQGRQ